MDDGRSVTSVSRGPLEVSFVTNLAAPYRRPVWERMADGCELTVALLESNRRILSDSNNRSADWTWSMISSRYAVIFLRTVAFRWAGNRYYLGLHGMSALVRDSHCVILGGWESPVYWQLRALSWWRKVPCVGFYESTSQSHTWTTGPIPLVRALFLRSMSAVVCPGSASRLALKDMGIGEHKIRQGFNPVDVADIREQADVSRAEDPAEVDADAFIYIGQLIPRKNIAGMLDAFASLPGPAKLTVAGTGVLRPLVEGFAARVQDDHRVEIVGEVPYGGVPSLLARHSTLLLLSTEEVWGLVVNEALAAGLHVVVSRRCGVAASVRGMTGVWVVEPEQQAIRQAMSDSARAWRGPIQDPEIFSASPHAFAALFMQTVREVTSST